MKRDQEVWRRMKDLKIVVRMWRKEGITNASERRSVIKKLLNKLLEKKKKKKRKNTVRPCILWEIKKKSENAGKYNNIQWTNISVAKYSTWQFWRKGEMSRADLTCRQTFHSQLVWVGLRYEVGICWWRKYLLIALPVPHVNKIFSQAPLKHSNNFIWHFS